MEKIKKIQEMEMGSAKYGVTQFSDLTGQSEEKFPFIRKLIHDYFQYYLRPRLCTLLQHI